MYTTELFRIKSAWTGEVFTNNYSTVPVNKDINIMQNLNDATTNTTLAVVDSVEHSAKSNITLDNMTAEKKSVDSKEEKTTFLSYFILLVGYLGLPATMLMLKQGGFM